MSQDTRNQIMELEDTFWRRMIAGHHSAAAQMLTQRSVLSGDRGALVITHDDYINLAKLTPESAQLKDFRLEDVDIVMPNDDVAVISYTALSVFNTNGQTHTQRSAVTTTWVRSSETWLAAAHTDTPLAEIPAPA